MVEPNTMYERILWYIFAPLRAIIRFMRWSIHNPSRLFVRFVAVYLVVALSVFLVVRTKFPFWSRQPVFHAGLFMLKPWQFMYPVGVIRDPSCRELTAEISREPFSRWYIRDIVRYQWKHPSRYSKTELGECRDFLAENFYSRRRNGVKYCPLNDNWLNPFDDPGSRLSVFRGEKLLNTRMRPIRGIMGSFPLRMRLFDKKWRDIKMNYVDYLCIARGQRRQGLAEKLIYSHCSRLSFDNLRNKHRTVNSSVLFKREDGSSGNWWQMGIVPLWRYTAVGLCLGDDSVRVNATSNYPYLSLENAWSTWDIEALPPSFRLSNAESVQTVREVMLRLQTERIRGGEENVGEDIANHKTLLITPEWSGIAKMIERKQLIIHVLRDEMTFEILGCYFWKKNETFYFEENKVNDRNRIPSIELQCAVWFGKDRQHPLFFSGFHASTERVFREMCGGVANKSKESSNTTDIEKGKASHSRSLIVWLEPIGDAGVIVERIREKSGDVMTTPMAYFTHNFSIPSIDAGEVVAIGV